MLRWIRQIRIYFKILFKWNWKSDLKIQIRTALKTLKERIQTCQLSRFFRETPVFTARFNLPHNFEYYRKTPDFIFMQFNNFNNT